MKSQDIIESFSAIARAKNIDRAELGTIIEELFRALLEKHFGEASNCSIIVNMDKGEIEIYQEKKVVEEVLDPIHEIELEDAVAVEPGLQVGDPFIEVVDPDQFGRRLVIAARQLLTQRIRDIEKKHVFEDFSQRVGEIVIGDIRQIQRDNILVHIEQAELRLPKSEQIPMERYRRGGTIRAIVKSVELTPKGPDIVISRSDERFLKRLFELEVPEIEEGIIEFVAVSRSPGERAKIVVRSTDRRIDPVGACVGMRGSRIQSVVRELNGEKIDVINFSSQPEVLISRALSPARPLSLFIDEQAKYCLAVFDDADMDAAIGRSAQNVLLASRATGYKIEAVKKSEHQASRKTAAPAVFLDQVPGLTPRMVSMLMEASVHTVEEFLAAQRPHLLSVKGMGEKTLDMIEERVNAFSAAPSPQTETVAPVAADSNASGPSQDAEMPAMGTDISVLAPAAEPSNEASKE